MDDNGVGEPLPVPRSAGSGELPGGVDRPHAQVAIIGAGLMGVGIAQVFARAGHSVRIFDLDARTRATVGSRLATTCSAAGDSAAEVVARTTVVDQLALACSDADVVIEAATEQVEVKRRIFQEVETCVRDHALIGTNTSSIPLSQLDGALTRPDRLVGTHFWQPPYLVPLVEVVSGEQSSGDAVRAMMTLLAHDGMRPVRVDRDVPGIIGNRLQHALKREAIALLAEGVASAETIDEVVRHGFGQRLSLVGPLEQSDLVGLDLTLAIHQFLMPDLDVTRAPHPLLASLVERGHLGAKTGHGFYDWSAGAADRRRAEISDGLTHARANTATTDWSA